MMKLKLLSEDTDLAPVIDDVLADLPPNLSALMKEPRLRLQPLPVVLGVMCEAKLAGIGWRTMLAHLDDADLDRLSKLVTGHSF